MANPRQHPNRNRGPQIAPGWNQSQNVTPKARAGWANGFAGVKTRLVNETPTFTPKD